ncbi:ATP-binding cassette sub-family F member 3-like [Ornithodoros turicata]|uniref:ATP-binding cassette sub-family F member 3-like n=1 Tax=Ornithodoros turicata TaxID=34597 RepID=UPI003138756F
MEAVEDVLIGAFPNIDEELFDYLEGVLDGGKDDFVTPDDIYDAVGDMLHEISEDSKDEGEIRDICSRLLEVMKGETGAINGDGNVSCAKVLSAPVQLKMMAQDYEDKSAEVTSIWVKQRDNTLQVDQKKLEKAEARLRQKQEKREGVEKPSAPPQPVLKAATASQAVSKREARLESKGGSRVQDIRIENFDIAFGEKSLLCGADLTLCYGRRYGLVGRNGIGKTTLLRMLSSGQLKIPSHISILHVEQEVVGDDTTALDSVLSCDEKRQRLLDEEKRLTALAAKECENEDHNISEQLSQVYAELQHIEADRAPAKASVILAGLGFTPAMQQKKTREFSGGWRMRIALARALFTKPDLLLLDEPTNMLDMKAIIWLETYLQEWQSTLLVVSHDRLFLDSVPTDILHFHSQRIDSYRGNYENFVKVMTEKLKNQQREYEAQQQYRAHVQTFIDRFRYNANRAALVQSKIKMLEKLPELKPVEKEAVVTLRFPDPEPLFPPILQLDEVTFSYSSGHNILEGVNLSANMQSRICIVGDNGSGKTTLLKILTGELNPTSGIRHVHRNLVIGYFTQHHVDQLELGVCSLEFMARRFPGKSAEYYRQQLGSFGVTGDLALQSIGSLSGGQKSRVAFAIMSMLRPHFLILDEPTNHLDIETIEALGHSLNTFQGGVVLVSHDERLIQLVCQELWVCGNKNVCSIEGGFPQYRKLVEEELESQGR